MPLLRSLFLRRRPLAALAALAVAAPAGASLAAHVRARLPDPWNGNRHITVVTDAPPPGVGTPFLRIEPGLAVIGVVEGPAMMAESMPSQGDVASRVSVFPEAQGLIREDSVIELRVTSPDLLEIVVRHFTPGRRARLAERVQAWRAAHAAAIETSLARLRAIAERELGADELGRKLYEDEKLRAALSAAFEREVLDPIDWDAVVGRALGSDAASSTGELLKHAGPIGSSWDGLRAGYRSRWAATFGRAREGGGAAAQGAGRTLDALREGDIDEALLEGGGTLGDVLDRGDAGRLARDPQGWVLDRAFSLLLPDPRAFKDAAYRRAGENLKRALPKHKDRLATDYAALGRELAEKNALGDRSLAALRSIAQDEALRKDLVARHGPEAAKRLERLSAAIVADAGLAESARAVLDSALELLAGTLRELALDDAGKGPNPLLVAFVRARLRGGAQPVLILRSAGSGMPVSEGQVYVSRRR